MWDWVDHRTKEVLVETERFLHGVPGSMRVRPKTVVSLIRIKNSPRQPAKNLPLAFNGGHVMDGRPLNIEGGHVIGIAIGGVDEQENVVPMYSHVNRGTFLSIEKTISRDYIPGKSMGVSISLDYTTSPDGRIPTNISVTLMREMTIDPVALGRVTGTTIRVDDISNAPQQAARIEIDPHLQAYLQQVQKRVDAGWTIESAEEATRSWVAEKKLPPVGNRPYALLDWILFMDPGNQYLPMQANIGTIGPGRPFTDRQRELIQLVNRYRQTGEKKGECWSDVAEDRNQCALIQVGTDTGIEVDHILPMKPVGSNAFSNAQITSAGHNRSKSNTT
jgi:hypothetical protein